MSPRESKPARQALAISAVGVITLGLIYAVHHSREPVETVPAAPLVTVTQEVTA